MIEIVLIIFNDDFEILLEKKTRAVIKKVHFLKVLNMKSRLNVIVYT